MPSSTLIRTIKLFSDDETEIRAVKCITDQVVKIENDKVHINLILTWISKAAPVYEQEILATLFKQYSDWFA